MEFNEIEKKILTVQENYCQHFGIEMDEEYVLHKLHEEVGEFAQAWLIHQKKCRPEKYLSDIESKKLLAEELSDIVGYAILNAKLLDIDLEKAISEKWFKHLK